jgi:hypothetical protein
VNSLACLLIGPVAGLAADVAGTWTVADHSEADVRRVSTPDSSVKAAVDVQTAPQTGLKLSWPEFNVLVGYGLSLAWIDLTNATKDQNGIPVPQERPILNHAAQIGLGWTPSPDWQLSLSLGASYGKRNYLGLVPAQTFTTMMPAPTPGAGQPPPPPPTQGPAVNYVPLSDIIVKTGALNGALGASHRFDAQWSGHAVAGYTITGGIDETDQEIVPRSHGPNAAIGATYGISRTDDLSTTVTASDTRVTTMAFRVEGAGGEFQTLTVSEGWGHRFSEQTNGSIGGGLVTQRYRPRYGYSWGTSTLPAANASLSHTESLEKESKLNLNASTALGTGYNNLTGQILYGVSAAVSVGYTYEHFGATATVSGGESLHLRATDPETSRSLSTSLTFSYAPVELIDFQAGARSSWQFVPNAPSTPPGGLFVFFVGIGVRAPPVMF